MELEDLTKYGEFEWSYVLNLPSRTESYGPYVDTTAKEILTQADKGEVTLDRMQRIEKLYVDSPEGYGSQNVFALVQLTDGWATLVAWCNTTGWDCRSGGDWRWAATREEAIKNGLGNEERQALELSIE